MPLGPLKSMNFRSFHLVRLQFKIPAAGWLCFFNLDIRVTRKWFSKTWRREFSMETRPSEIARVRVLVRTGSAKERDLDQRLRWKPTKNMVCSLRAPNEIHGNCRPIWPTMHKKVESGQLPSQYMIAGQCGLCQAFCERAREIRCRETPTSNAIAQKTNFWTSIVRGELSQKF